MKNNKIKTIIVDDEQECRDLTVNLLSEFPDIEIIACCENAEKALESIIQYLPDLVFLDIQMPLKTGFDLLDDLKKINITHPEIVFVTAYDHYALEAIKNSAFDFLLKPIDIIELEHTINKFKIRDTKNNFLHKINVLFDYYSLNKKIKFNTRTGFITINPEEILYCNADGNYTMIYQVNQKNELITNNIGQLELSLPKKVFFRINRSQIININYLISVNRKIKNCTLKHESFQKEFQISGDKLKELENMF